MEINKEVLSNIFNSLGDSISKEHKDLYEKIISSSKIKSFDGPEEFYYAVLYPWKKFIRGLIANTISKNSDVKFIYEQYNFIESHFVKLIEKFEGSTCCADKSRTIVNRLLNFYLTGEEIKFNYEGEYTYHLPSKIFKDHESIVEFYDGLNRLYYGNPDNYLKALLKLQAIK